MSVFDPQSFANPANELRPLQIVHGMDGCFDEAANAADKVKIAAHLEKLAQMGIGGVVTNVSFTDYLVSPARWAMYRDILQKADELGMELWWYDERGYPSGSAGGIVPRSHPEYVVLGLACYRQEVQGPQELRFDLPVSCKKTVWVGAVPDAQVATRSSVLDLRGSVDAQGTLRWQVPGGRWTLLYLAERVMYEGTHCTANVSDFKHYVNLLNPDAVREFLRVTHEQYYRETPAALWSKVRAVFTDEPSLMTSYAGELPERFRGKIPVVDAPLFQDRPAAVPWVEDFPARFQALKGYDLLPNLYALYCSSTDEACLVRQDYFEVLTRLYTDAFYVQVLRWCQQHGIRSSGHVMAEENIVSHVCYHGSLFSVIRQMDGPGIDMLNSDPQSMLGGDPDSSLKGESFMAIKQVASVAHLTGAKQIHSESSDWVQGNEGRHASLAERMGQGNLQYVLGVNQITAYWGWQEIGAEQYRAYNDYMGRLASLLTGGRHACDVAVLYPVRSAWAHFLPSDKPFHFRPGAGEPTPLERVAVGYPDLVRKLLRAQVDLDIIDEEAILAAELRDGALYVADERYRAVVLPPLYSLGLETARKLQAFARAGGVLLAAGPLPVLAENIAAGDALRQEFATLFAAGKLARVVPLGEMAAVLHSKLGADLALAEPNADILYTHRQYEGKEVYFIINNAATATTIKPTLGVAGAGTLYRPLDGTVGPAPEAIALAGYEGVFVVK
jgi:hypothetical protein